MIHRDGIVRRIFAFGTYATDKHPQAEIWLDRCYFDYGKRAEGKWTNRQIDEELAELNAIIVGLSAKVAYNDDWLELLE